MCACASCSHVCRAPARAHTHTHRWRDASFPHFRCVSKANGEFDLAYTSKRGSLLMPFVQGLIATISDEMFNTPVDISVVETHDHGGRFSIRYRRSGNAASPSAGDSGPSQQTPAGRDVGLSSSPAPTSVAQDVLQRNGLSASFLLDQWPFFLLMDENMDVLAAGFVFLAHSIVREHILNRWQQRLTCGYPVVKIWLPCCKDTRTHSHRMRSLKV